MASVKKYKLDSKYMDDKCITVEKYAELKKRQFTLKYKAYYDMVYTILGDSTKSEKEHIIKYIKCKSPLDSNDLETLINSMPYSTCQNVVRNIKRKWRRQRSMSSMPFTKSQIVPPEPVMYNSVLALNYILAKPIPTIPTPIKPIPVKIIPAIPIPIKPIPAIPVPYISIPAISIPAIPVPAIPVSSSPVSSIPVPAISIPAISIPAKHTSIIPLNIQSTTLPLVTVRPLLPLVTVRMATNVSP